MRDYYNPTLEELARARRDNANADAYLNGTARMWPPECLTCHDTGWEDNGCFCSCTAGTRRLEHAKERHDARKT